MFMNDNEMLQIGLDSNDLQTGSVGIVVVGFILPGHYESKLLISKQPGDQQL